MQKYVGTALWRAENGRYKAKPSDLFVRSIRFATAEGLTNIDVRGARLASRVAEYWNAVDHYLKTGETDPLNKFVDKSIKIGPLVYPFITDPRILNRLANAGEVAFEDLYAK